MCGILAVTVEMNGWGMGKGTVGPYSCGGRIVLRSKRKQTNFQKQEKASQYTSIFQAPVCTTFGSITLGKTRHS